MNYLRKTVRDLPVYYILPILFTVVIVPLIVYLRVIPLDNTSFQFWTGDKNNVDFFSWYKAKLTIIFAGASLIVFIAAYYKGILEIKKLAIYYAPIFAYALLIVLSTANSKYPITARDGFADRYEGAFVLLAYLAVLFTTMNLINNEKHIKLLLGGLFISAFIVGTIGIFQYFGLDLFKSALGKVLILPAQYRSSNLSFTFGPYTIYSTLYNTNYVGSYTAMLFPLCLAVFLYVKKPYLKIMMAVMTCLMFANWVGCRSRAGYMGGVAAVILLVILLRKSIIKNYRTVLPLFLSFILIFFGMDVYAGGEMSKRILTTIEGINDYGTTTATQAAQQVVLQDIVLLDKRVSIVCKPNSLNMELEGTDVILKDAEGTILQVKGDDSGNIEIADKRYEPFKLHFDTSYNIFTITFSGKIISIAVQDGKFRIIGERNILLDKIDHPEAVGFKGKERFASSRGYIWSRSIPLLKNNIIIGGGPDTFVMQFPQHDYVGKIIAFDKASEIVDKPHNMYLQIAINTGILSLLAVLFLFGAYLVSSLKIYAKRTMPEGLDIFGIALFCAVLGYVITALANDSLVSVAPVFWAVLGLGISCNYLIKKGVDIPAAAVKKRNKVL